MKILLAARGFLPYLIIAFLNASVDLAHKITIQNTLLKSFEGDTQIVLTALINAILGGIRAYDIACGAKRDLFARKIRDT